MASPPKPWKAEYAKSSRASCKTCKNPIGQETLRLGKMVQATQFDGFMPIWNHADCILRKAKQIKLVDDVEGLELLRWEDQQKIRRYIEDQCSEPSTVSSPAVVGFGVEVSQTSRATCRHCSQKIMKGEVRISSKSLAWHHANCFMEISPTTQVEKLSGWHNLSASDQAAVLALVKRGFSTAKGESGSNEEPGKRSISNAGAKRKRAEEESCADEAVSDRKNINPKDEHTKAPELESLLELQSRALWALKDDLKKHVSTAELCVMLQINKQNTTGTELDLLERCVDGMLFGALSRCPRCRGHLRYSSGMYRCHGYLSAWSKCAYSASKPERVKEKWKIPEGTRNEYLLKWFKTQKWNKPARILPPTSSVASGSQAANGSSQASSKSENLGDLRVSISGFGKGSIVWAFKEKGSIEKWKSSIEAAGGKVHDKIQKDTNCLVVTDGLNDQDAEIRKARRMKIPILREDYLTDCIERGKKLPFDLYKIEAIGGERHSLVTVKVKGHSPVHESSGLQDSGHILEDGKSVYNTTLSLSDLSTGVNSYYILQIIQDDRGSGCHVFRKWGRVGNNKIGGNKLECMSKPGAVQLFKSLFLEKTGNSWEAWEGKRFQKQRGRFYPVDIDYGIISGDIPRKKNLSDRSNRLEPPVIELMKMLFNVETYRAVMLEFEINMSEMPLGKLSKSNIQKGFEALTEIQNLLSTSGHHPSIKERRLIDASNRFFTMIPSINPHIIRDEDEFKSKVREDP